MSCCGSTEGKADDKLESNKVRRENAIKLFGKAWQSHSEA